MHAGDELFFLKNADFDHRRGDARKPVDFVQGRTHRRLLGAVGDNHQRHGAYFLAPFLDHRFNADLVLADLCLLLLLLYLCFGACRQDRENYPYAL